MDDREREVEDLVKEIRRRAEGTAPERTPWVPSLDLQERFEEVLKDIADLRIVKVAGYGEDRYDVDRWSEEEQLWMIFSDIYRKFIRLRTQVRNADVDGMRETCMDIASYGAMGVQIIDMYNERDGR